jgi:hypothetical protein
MVATMGSQTLVALAPHPSWPMLRKPGRSPPLLLVSSQILVAGSWCLGASSGATYRRQVCRLRRRQHDARCF